MKCGNNILEKKDYALIIPGHGEVTGKQVLFERQFEYLDNAKKLVEKIISSGGKLQDLDSIRLSDCIRDTSYLYKERLDYWHKQNLMTMFLQLKK
jgi:hypothetical protein